MYPRSLPSVAFGVYPKEMTLLFLLACTGAPSSDSTSVKDGSLTDSSTTGSEDSGSGGGSDSAPDSASDSGVATTAPAIGEEVPDWSLVDVNPYSVTLNQAVSPRDYVGQVAGFYFFKNT